MSTKTSIKRIAAVAAVALTLGGFSAVSAHATAVAATSTLAATGGTTSASAAGIAATAKALSDGNHYVTLNWTAVNTVDSATVITSSGVGSLYGVATASTGVNVNYNNGSNTANGFNIYKGTTFGGQLFGSADTVTFTAVSAVAGTQTITATPINGTSAASTITITWGPAPVVSAAYSSSYLYNSNANRFGAAPVDNTVAAGTSVSTGGGIGIITVNVLGSDSAPYGGATVTATVAGAGLVLVDDQNTFTTNGTAKSSSSTTSASTKYVHISSDGTSGVGTITVAVTDPVTGATITVGTKTVTFVGSTTSVKATANLKVLKAGSNTYNGLATAAGALTVTNTIAVTGYTYDSNGNRTNASTAVKIVSSDPTVLTAGACTPATQSPLTSGFATTQVAPLTGEYNCIVNGVATAASGSKATITFEAADSTGAYTILATPVTLAIGGSIAKEVLTTDASSYAPLSPVVITVTATDSAGNPVYDQDTVPVASGTVTASSLLGGAGIGTFSAIVGGVATAKGAYAPAAEVSSITLSATDVTAAANTLTASFTVSGSASTVAAQAAVDAANEATDAANAATDAANNAMDSADAAQQAALDAGDKADAALTAVTDLATKVSAIATQIAALSALVKKIAAKVKA